jgi:hypothetical protein
VTTGPRIMAHKRYTNGLPFLDIEAESWPPGSAPRLSPRIERWYSVRATARSTDGEPAWR